MLIVTNRNIVHENFEGGVGDHRAFGDMVNAKGPNEIRLARAKKNENRWELELIQEPESLSANNLPSREVFRRLKEMLVKENKNCVFYIHGYNQSLHKNLEKALKLEQEYGVEVIVFSWPSNPGGSKFSEYRHTRRVAHASIGALDSTLEKLVSYLQEPFNKESLESGSVKFSLLAHSLGSYLFHKYVHGSLFENEAAIFENIVLCQADVDNRRHKNWVDKIGAGKRVYITINENDWALKWSDASFQRDRLGRSVKNLNANNAIYFDFTDGVNVGNTHGLFYKKTNNIVKEIFSNLLNGARGEYTEGLSYDRRTNTYRF